MFDLNWNAVIFLKYEYDEFYWLWLYYRNGKNQINTIGAYPTQHTYEIWNNKE
ncbi:hypothetical protein [Spiroplasma kunkelii]|uniref:hypothetical protein n=1 Tax=Spiroplasma kunkelii TaxID=47834 RepID=UPI000AA1E633|nr:hypothetical protein [Spiroplasma kunkelii]